MTARKAEIDYLSRLLEKNSMNKFFAGAAAAVAAVACTTVSEKTTLKSVFADAEFPLYVHVQVPDMMDTVITLDAPEFNVDVPVNKLAYSTLSFSPDSTDEAAERVGFISDGTVLTIAPSDDRYVVTSSAPRKSVQEAFNRYANDSHEFVAAYRDAMGVIADSTSLSDEQKDSLQEAAYNAYIDNVLESSKKAISENPDNIVSVIALQHSYYDFSDGALDTLLNGLDSTVASNEFVGKVRSALNARKETAEGMMFKDFTIPQPDGKDASLSDYVGKGKYVLVDFWASWCRPCKHEIPNVKAVYEKYHGDNFDVLSVAVWEKTAQASIDTAKAYGVSWNQIVDAKSVPTEMYGIQGIPHIILFAPDGTILKRELYGDAIEEEVSKYVR